MEKDIKENISAMIAEMANIGEKRGENEKLFQEIMEELNKRIKHVKAIKMDKYVRWVNSGNEYREYLVIDPKEQEIYLKWENIGSTGEGRDNNPYPSDIRAFAERLEEVLSEFVEYLGEKKEEEKETYEKLRRIVETLKA